MRHFSAPLSLLKRCKWLPQILVLPLVSVTLLLFLFLHRPGLPHKNYPVPIPCFLFRCRPIPCSFLYTPLSFRNCLRLLLALLRCHNCKSLPSNAPGHFHFSAFCRQVSINLSSLGVLGMKITRTPSGRRPVTPSQSKRIFIPVTG